MDGEAACCEEEEKKSDGVGFLLFLSHSISGI